MIERSPLTARSVELLREVMELEGIKNPEQLGRRTGTQASPLRKILSGTRQPTMETIETLLTKLGYEIVIDIRPK